MIDPTEFAAAKSAIDLIRSLWDWLRKGAATQKIKELEQAQQCTDAQRAQGFGYPLCVCTFPPSIMLWKKQEQAYVCPACQRQQGLPKPVRVRRSSWQRDRV